MQELNFLIHCPHLLKLFDYVPLLSLLDNINITDFITFWSTVPKFTLYTSLWIKKKNLVFIVNSKSCTFILWIQEVNWNLHLATDMNYFFMAY